MNWVLIAILLAVLAIGLALWVIYRVLNSIHDTFTAIVEEFRGFTVAPDEKTPSQFAQTVQAMGQVLGHAAAVEAKTFLMGKASAASRQIQGAEADIQQSQMEAQQPLLSGLVEAVPSLSKRLRKSPGLMDLLMALAPRVLGSGGPGGGNGTSRGSSSSTSRLDLGL